MRKKLFFSLIEQDVSQEDVYDTSANKNESFVDDSQRDNINANVKKNLRNILYIYIYKRGGGAWFNIIIMLR